MTPAINLLIKKKVKHQIHEYQHDVMAHRAGAAYGLEAANKLGISADRVFKTLVVSVDNKELVVAVIPTSAMLSMKRVAKAAKAKKAVMANKDDVQRSTGYVLGGVSPLGQKKRLRTFFDESMAQFETVYISAGKRGLEIELNPADLAELLSAQIDDLQTLAD